MEERVGSSSSSRPVIALERNPKLKSGGALIGKIEATKELNRSTILQMAQKGWQLKDELEILDMDRNVFVFQFADKGDYQKVLNGRPWSIQTYLLNLQLWDDDMLYKEVCFNYCPFWVQFHGLPFGYMNQENAIKLGSAIGEVVMVENPLKQSKMVRKFLRARVVINIRNPLRLGFWVPREKKDDVWAEVKYERLPTFCYKCGILGHEQRLCDKTDIPVDEEVSYGSHLKGISPRFMEDLWIEVKKGWCEWKKKALTVARSLEFGNEREPGTGNQWSGQGSPQGGCNNSGRQCTTLQTKTNICGRFKSSEDLTRPINNGSPKNVKLPIANSKDDVGLKLMAQGNPTQDFLSKGAKKVSPKREKQGDQQEKGLNIKLGGGRIGSVIELVKEAGALEKAIIPYVPNSPISDVTGRLGGVKLKRTPPKIESPQCLKKLKIGEEESPRKAVGGSGVKINSKRKNVRRTKQSLRGKITSTPELECLSNSGKNVLSGLGFMSNESEGLDMDEGMGGRPQTAPQAS